MGETSRSRDGLLKHQLELAQMQFKYAYENAVSVVERAAKNLMLANPTYIRGCYAAHGHFYFVDDVGAVIDILKTGLSPKAKKELQFFITKYQDPFHSMFGFRYRKMTLRFDENNKLVVLR